MMLLYHGRRLKITKPEHKTWGESLPELYDQLVDNGKFTAAQLDEFMHLPASEVLQLLEGDKSIAPWQGLAEVNAELSLLGFRHRLLVAENLA